MSKRWLVLPVVVVTLVMMISATAEATSGTGPYLTLLFSRSAVTASTNCVANDTGVARLDTVVAPELFSRGLHPTGSIETGSTKEDSLWCGHYKETRFSSWSLAQELASRYGWSFISHTATRPNNEASWSALSPQGIYDETCGSGEQITAHGLPGAIGSFAWPNGYVYDPAMSSVQACFDFSRTYGMNGVTDQATATVAPYNQPARGLNGGACNDASAACSTYTFAHAPSRYRSPVAISDLIASAQPSEWITIQTYLLVTGSRSGLWDCTSPDWHQHWTYDTERYCWNDYLSILSSLPATITVTDPASVGTAWGRVAPGQPAATSIRLSPATSRIEPEATQAYTAEGYDSLGNDIGDVTAQTVFTVDGGGSCADNACTATQPGTFTVTGTIGGVTGTAQLTVVTAVRITSFTPGKGAVGSTVGISGSGFAGASRVTFAGTGASFTIVSPTQMVATVPSGARTGPIAVAAPGGSATSASSFGVLPAISGFTPTGGTVGTAVTINGSAFTGTTAVRFGGAPSVFTVVSYGKITASVPSGAITGKISVITPSGSATTGSNFQVKPTITGFTPSRGPVGTVVTINGTGFAGATAVKFHSTVASYTIMSSTQLRAIVPVGATTGAISVSTRGGTARSGVNFRVSG